MLQLLCTPIAAPFPLVGTKLHNVQKPTTTMAGEVYFQRQLGLRHCVHPLDSVTPTTVEELPEGLKRELLPKHVAIIMDGNSRWAKARGQNASVGHIAGYSAFSKIVKLSAKWGITVLTVYALSSENWFRSKSEVHLIMMLFERAVKENMDKFVRKGYRVRIIGDRSKFPKTVQNVVSKMEESTRNNSRLNLNVAVAYGGRSDIVQACQKIAQNVKQGLLKPEEVTESLISQELSTNCEGAEFRYPDLLIRTSGEMRLSNFLLWESAYTELYFAKTYWPDFSEADYAEALLSFQQRQRRFGLRIDT